jgi:glycosyltransferase involved in cell wall biosynthesis
MKVLVFTTVFPNSAQPTQGSFVFERIRHLAELAEVRVVAPVNWRVRLRAHVPRRHSTDGIDVSHPTFWYIPGIFKVLDGVLLFCSALLTLRRVRREFPFELIDAHFVFPDGFAAVLLARWFDCPVVITERGTATPLSKYKLRSKAMGWAFRNATRVVAVARHLGELAIALGARRDRVSVIPNGVNSESFAPVDRREARRQLHLPDDRRLIVSVGRLIPSKGFGRVIRALPALRREIPTLLFSVVGGDPSGEKGNAAELQRLVRQLGVGEHVIFAGELPRESVALWLSAADLFVLASDMEGCPNVVWEALACGRPVVATKVGEVERMVPDFGGVLFDDPDDAAALDLALREALEKTWDEEAIRAYAAAHTWSDVAARVFEEWVAARNEGMFVAADDASTQAGQ